MERYIYRGQFYSYQMIQWQMLQRCATCLSVTQALSRKNRTDSNGGDKCTMLGISNVPQMLTLCVWVPRVTALFWRLWSLWDRTVNYTPNSMPSYLHSLSATWWRSIRKHSWLHKPSCVPAPNTTSFLMWRAETVKQNTSFFHWVVL